MIGKANADVAARAREKLAADPDAPKYPNLVKVLNRTAQVTSLGACELARADADVVIAPVLADVGLTEYSTAERVIAAGYAEAQKVLGPIESELESWR